MSKVKARTEASPEEQSSREYDLHEEMDKKLTQAKGICGVMLHMRDIDSLMADAVWAAESLIEETEKVFEELRHIYHRRRRPRRRCNHEHVKYRT